ncbi:Response regulator c-di-GMP phosphodiesterase, RpfG family, contains REC and HD-GYP domains [Marinobacter persicus]|uniref:Response regulator c-di-GMP phosphodiesterase, RpfG family, contains REC and HD-GYP domains n=1 Tax=Marinobacter persicus TaxID=930118 RepID=A0A1I3SMN5_9GAMM|nr:HD domain-containing phosphohydrolase [Marinobacter persicus]GHD41239.1 two-component system response regulator [Marinobacter persicus]SFJ60074.1 Response regulator c-di-GMP phosphodiesterase, RpfG family, contains REC and HD-GYP domains [Marinobacter persicus]
MADQTVAPEKHGPPLPASAKVLLVDDEENILRSLQRVLRREPWELTTVISGEDALAVLAEQKFDLVISDARMPGMDGPTLLAEIRRKYPWCIRILLTGYADITSTISAINDGQIYRYISKPWDDDELRLVIRQALAFQHSERRRLALEKLTRKQNKELQALNANLEEKVKERTEELEEAAGMVEVAYQELRQSYVTTTEVFSSLINKRLPAERRPNAKVIHLVKTFADYTEMGKEATENLAMAGALYNLGKLSWKDDLFAAPSDLLKKDDRLEYLKYPVTGEQLLMALEPLKDTARIIRHHQEKWNGYGVPDRLEGDQIPYESRLLKIAVDYVELQLGLILQRKVARENAIKLLKRYRNRLYDPELVDRFIDMLVELAPDIDHDDPSVKILDTLRLKPGMILARNLYAASGMLLLNEGKVLTALLIEKLAAFEQGEPDGHRYILYVREPEEDEDDTENPA